MSPRKIDTIHIEKIHEMDKWTRYYYYHPRQKLVQPSKEMTEAVMRRLLKKVK